MSEEKQIDKAGKSDVLGPSSEKTTVTVEKGDHHLVCDAGGSPNGTKVHPQPTNDPLDPLNWPKMQKHVILAIVMLK